MAIKQAREVAVDFAAYEYLAVQIAAKVKNRDTGEIKTDRLTGLPVWSVDCLRTEQGGGPAATVAVSVPSKQEPNVAGQKVKFPNLIALQWATETASGLAFRADAVEVVSPRAAGKGQS